MKLLINYRKLYYINVKNRISERKGIILAGVMEADFIQ